MTPNRPQNPNKTSQKTSPNTSDHHLVTFYSDHPKRPTSWPALCSATHAKSGGCAQSTSAARHPKPKMAYGHGSKNENTKGFMQVWGFPFTKPFVLFPRVLFLTHNHMNRIGIILV